MDWSQFADPQFLLGIGVVAFGVINAYMLRRRNLQVAAEETEHAEEQEAEAVKQPEAWQSTNTTEFSGLIDQTIQGEEEEGFEAIDETLTMGASTEGEWNKVIQLIRKTRACF